MVAPTLALDPRVEGPFSGDPPVRRTSPCSQQVDACLTRAGLAPTSRLTEDLQRGRAVRATTGARRRLPRRGAARRPHAVRRSAGAAPRHRRGLAGRGVLGPVRPQPDPDRPAGRRRPAGDAAAVRAARRDHRRPAAPDGRDRPARRRRRPRGPRARAPPGRGRAGRARLQPDGRPSPGARGGPAADGQRRVARAAHAAGQRARLGRGGAGRRGGERTSTCWPACTRRACTSRPWSTTCTTCRSGTPASCAWIRSPSSSRTSSTRWPRRSGPRAGADLEVAVEPGARIVADPLRLRQAVGNLVANALRHTPAGGRVTLRGSARHRRGRRHRRGDPGRGAAVRLRPVPPGRPVPLPRDRRERPRPGHRPPDRGGARRHGRHPQHGRGRPRHRR